MTTEQQAPAEQQETAQTPWVFVDKYENLITSGGGAGSGSILFVYPSMVPDAYDEFAGEVGGYGDLDDYDATEKLHDTVEKFVIGWEREGATK